MSKLDEVQREWLESYFLNVSNVWNAWKSGHVSMRERDETLAWYRKKLWELRNARRRRLVLRARPEPGRDDDWTKDPEL